MIKPLFFLLILMAFSQSFAGINVVHTSLQSVSKKGKDNQVRTIIAMCEKGSCKSLVKRAGYTQGEWNQIASMCRRHQAIAPLRTVVKYVGEIAGFVFKSSPAGAFSFILTTFATSPEEERAVRAANRRMGSAFNKLSIELSVGEFYQLTEGIKVCANKLEDKYRHQEMGRRVMNK